MRICTSATLTKILLGIASAGALFVSPVRAEPTPVGDSADALSEAPAPSEASSPSGAEQLLPLNPPSVPVEPTGAGQLQPVTPASSLEPPAQVVPETAEGVESIEATESTESPEDVEPIEATESTEVPEDTSASEEVPEEETPLVEGSGSADEEGETIEEAEAPTEEEDSSAVGGAEDIAPEDGIDAPVEDSAGSEESGLEDSEPADPALLEEGSPVEESEISPSSAAPNATSQLMAQGEDPAAVPDSSGAPAPEAAPEGESGVPPSAPAPSAAPTVSDQELQQFANAVPELRTVEQGTQKEISAVIQGSGFDETRFNEIYQSQQSPDAPAAEVTEEEKQTFTKALSDIQVIEEKSKAEQEKIIQAQGLEPERFVEILISLRQDPALQTKMQEMIPN